MLPSMGKFQKNFSMPLNVECFNISRFVLITATALCNLQPASANQVADYSSTGLIAGNGPGTAKVTFAPDGFAIEEAGKEEVYDFQNKRVYSITKADKTYTEANLNALVYFCVSELSNRQVLNKVLASKTLKTPILDAFEVESGLGIVMPDQKKDAAIEPVVQESTTGDTIIYAHDGKTVVSLVPSQNLIDASCRKSYDKFIAYGCPIHPEIRKNILSKPYLPAELEFRFANELGKSDNKTTAVAKTGKLVLQNVHAEPDASISASELSGLNLTRTKSELSPIWQALDARGANPKFPSREDAIEYAQNAAANNRPLDALLSLLEYGLETGETLLEPIKELKPALAKDENAHLFLTYLSPANDTEAAAARKSLAQIDRSKLEKGAVIDIMQGNIESSLGHDEVAKQLLLKALIKNPLVVGAYHDLGEGLTRDYQMELAWQCFDEARKLRPDHPMLKSITEMEAKLQQDFPDFF